MSRFFLLPAGLLSSGGCPAVPGSACRRLGSIRLRPRPRSQESPAACGHGGGCHEIAPQRYVCVTTDTTEFTYSLQSYHSLTFSDVLYFISFLVYFYFFQFIFSQFSKYICILIIILMKCLVHFFKVFFLVFQVLLGKITKVNR